MIPFTHFHIGTNYFFRVYMKTPVYRYFLQANQYFLKWQLKYLINIEYFNYVYLSILMSTNRQVDMTWFKPGNQVISTIVDLTS